MNLDDLIVALHAIRHEHSGLWKPNPMCGCALWAQAIIDHLPPCTSSAHECRTHGILLDRDDVAEHDAGEDW